MIFLLFTSIAVATALKNNDGPCPTVYPVNNFNHTKYANGKWYELARYDNGWQGRSDCVDIEYLQLECGITYRTTAIRDEKREFSEGITPLPINKGEGYVNHISDLYRVTEGFSEIRTSIVDTDYENYSIVYSCQYNEYTNIRSEYSWILSRSSEATDYVEKCIDRYFKYSGVIEVKKLIWSGYWRKTCI